MIISKSGSCRRTIAIKAYKMKQSKKYLANGSSIPGQRVIKNNTSQPEHLRAARYAPKTESFWIPCALMGRFEDDGSCTYSFPTPKTTEKLAEVLYRMINGFSGQGVVILFAD